MAPDSEKLHSLGILEFHLDYLPLVPLLTLLLQFLCPQYEVHLILNSHQPLLSYSASFHKPVRLSPSLKLYCKASRQRMRGSVLDFDISSRIIISTFNQDPGTDKQLFRSCGCRTGSARNHSVLGQSNRINNVSAAERGTVYPCHRPDLSSE